MPRPGEIRHEPGEFRISSEIKKTVDGGDMQIRGRETLAVILFTGYAEKARTMVQIIYRKC